MWEEYGHNKAEGYISYKFKPIHRIGLTNFLREKLILEFLDPNKEDVVLDVGCASGQQLFKIAKTIKEGHGTDIAQNFIDVANKNKIEKNLKNLHFSRSTLEDLPFQDEFFDKIICAEVFEHVFDKDKGILELKRVLKKNGILIISVPNMNADATFWGRFLRVIKVRKFKPLDNFTHEELKRHGDAHVREFKSFDLWNWVKENGFEPLTMKSVSFIDGPKWFEFILKIPLRISFTQKLILNFENWLTSKGLFWGRHLVIKARK